MKASGPVRASGRISSHIDLLALNPVPSEYVSCKRRDARIVNDYSHEPVKQKIAGETEYLQFLVTVCCFLWSCCIFLKKLRYSRKTLGNLCLLGVQSGLER